MSDRYGRPFRFGAALVSVGVVLHVWEYVQMRDMGYRMADLSHSPTMLVGMVLLVGGLATLSAPMLRADRRRYAAQSMAGLEAGRLGRAQVMLVLVAVFALMIDVMKPATLGFVLPGMRAEYGLTKGEAGILPLVALSGTALGSVAWGALADRIGRRPAVLLSALLFIATSVCGTMPSLAYNLIMCFFMGASAGGLLPVMFTLLAEIIPRHLRGLVVVLVGAVSGTGGYLLASGAASLLEAEYSWRILWIIGAPTGLMLVVLQRFLPESPRFLIVQGREQEAVQVMRRFGLRETPPQDQFTRRAAAHASRTSLWSERHRLLTPTLTALALSWGLMNFGFLTWLPTMFTDVEWLSAPGAVNRLLAIAALIALPSSLVVALLYSGWSAKGTLLGAAVVAASALVAVGVLGAADDRSGLLGIALVLLIGSINAMNAMLIPYAAEVHPSERRGRGTGIIAGAGKLGGLAGVPAVSALLLLSDGPTLPAVALSVPLVVSILLFGAVGVETKGHELLEQAPDPEPLQVAP